MSAAVRRVAVADIGGTHARFALAEIAADGAIAVAEPIVLDTDSYPSFEAAWSEFGRRLAEPMPRKLAVSFAGPVDLPTIRLTNSAWQFTREGLQTSLGLDQLVIINDLAAIAQAVPLAQDSCFTQLCGPAQPLPARGVVSVVGLGTGLGLALLLNRDPIEVIGCEGGHIDFAPHDAAEANILERLAVRFGRVSAERMVSGQALRNIVEAMGGADDLPSDDRGLWDLAESGTHRVAAAALAMLLANLGSVAGDFALVQGANSLVLAGGLMERVAPLLVGSEFAARFIAKGRLSPRLEAVPVHNFIHSNPGLLGAASMLA